MAIMAMDMALNCWRFIAILLFFSTKVIAGDWQMSPAVSVNTTYTDNLTLATDNQESSQVNKAKVALTSQFDSRYLNFTFDGSTTLVDVSYDAELNDNYNELSTKGSLLLWKNGPSIVASSTVENRSRNEGAYGLVSIESGNTVQVTNNQFGIEYAINNSTIKLTSSLMQTTSDSEDGIGENDGVSTSISVKNGSAARHFFWQLSSTTSKRQNERYTASTENTLAKLGWFNSTNLTPIVVYSAESADGDFNSQTNELTSYGPGLRWQISPKLILESSYHYVDDETKSDNFVATNINWQPSARTSLVASHSKRFFGDSYGLDFNHRTRRLTNTISYNESLSAFDRSNGLKLLGYFWCPSEQASSTSNVNDLASCRLQPGNSSDYRLVRQIVADNETTNQFVLNKSLNWQSSLALSRTSFSLGLTNTRTEYITSLYNRESTGAQLNISRRLSPKSNLRLNAQFRKMQTDISAPLTSSAQANQATQAQQVATPAGAALSQAQQDYYRTFTLGYDKKLGRTLTTDMAIEYINRNSTSTAFIYSETRVALTINKDF